MRRVAILLSVGLLGALAAPVAAGPDRFDLDDTLTASGLWFSVIPGEHRLLVGSQVVVFHNDGDLPHTLAERSGMFEWGPIPPGGSVRFDPWAAGSYRFREANEELYTGGASGGLFVVEPRVGRDGWFGQRRIYVRWASRFAPEGWVYDVKYSRGGHWRWWIHGGRAPKKLFTVPNWKPQAPSSCLGFKARLRDADDPERRLGWGDTGVTCIVVDEPFLDR